MNLIVLESYISKPLRQLLKLQADTTGVKPGTAMVEMGNFLNDDGLQIVIESLQTAIYLIENKKMITAATEIIE